MCLLIVVIYLLALAMVHDKYVRPIKYYYSFLLQIFNIIHSIKLLIITSYDSVSGGQVRSRHIVFTRIKKVSISRVVGLSVLCCTHVLLFQITSKLNE